MPKNVAIILAGGSGDRFKSSVPKQFQQLDNNKIIDFSIRKFLDHEKINDVVIVCHEEWIALIKKEYPQCVVIKGGKTRQKSSFMGLNACPNNTDNVLIHDAARPFVSSQIITESLEALNNYDAVNISVPVSDTAILVKNNFIDSILNRKEIFLSQTPQSFKYKIILKAHKKNNKKNASDDIQLVKDLNVKCYNILGSKNNIKITHQIDLEIAEGLIKNKKI